VCSSAASCVDDGVCDILDEGCACADCVTIPQCQTGGSGTGSGASGSGGTSGSSGSSGSGGSGGATGSASSGGP
jgi:hypothetical protein